MASLSDRIMARIQLDVPVVAQAKANSCWHASASMIWLYWQQHGKGAGPMNTVASAYDIADTTPLSGAEFITLAQKVGLNRLPTKNHHSRWEIAKYLRKQGPIWAAGLWFGVGHAIVLTGIHGDTVYFNDPDQGVKKTGTVKWFNEKLFSQFYGSLMSKDPVAY